jgi:two-component system, chemotaxis family, chemotaxis protein CheY
MQPGRCGPGSGIYRRMKSRLKILIVEDEYISRVLLSEMLSVYGVCCIAVDGKEAVDVLKHSFDTGEPFDLVCLDIRMPEGNGLDVLRSIRAMEKKRGFREPHATKVIMTTALEDSKNIMQAFTQGHCQAYLIKPVDRVKLIQHLQDLKLIE